MLANTERKLRVRLLIIKHQASLHEMSSKNMSGDLILNKREEKQQRFNAKFVNICVRK